MQNIGQNISLLILRALMLGSVFTLMSCHQTYTPISSQPTAPNGANPQDLSRQALPTGKVPNTASSIRIDSAHFEFMRNEYEMDRYLSLSIHHIYRLTLNLKMVAPNGVSQSVPQGTYFVRGVLLSALEPQADADGRYLTQFLSKGVVTDDRLVIDINVAFGYDGLGSRALMNEIGLQVTPIDQDPRAIAPTSYSGSLPPVQQEATVSLVPATWDVAVVAANAAKIDNDRRAKLQVMSPVSLYKQYFGLKEPDDAILKGVELTRMEVEGALTHNLENASVLKKLCGLFYEPKSRTASGALLWECQNHPTQYLEIMKKTFVERMTSDNIKIPYGISSSVLPISFAFSQTKTETDNKVTGVMKTTSKSHNWSMGFGFGIAGNLGLDVLGTGAKIAAEAKAAYSYMWSFGKTWYSTEEHARAASTSTATTVSLGKSVSVDQMAIEFEADTRSCLFVRPRRHARETRNAPPFFLCSSQTQNKKVQETFYYLTQMWRNTTSFNNSFNPQSALISTLIRGEDRFANLVKILKNSTEAKPLIMTAGQPEDELSRIFSQYSNQEFPGLIETPAVY